MATLRDDGTFRLETKNTVNSMKFFDYISTEHMSSACLLQVAVKWLIWLPTYIDRVIVGLSSTDGESNVR